MSASKPRIVPLEPQDFGEEVQGVLGRGDAERRAPNILRTIAHQPKLLQPFLGFAAALSLRGRLPRRESELLALRAAWNCRSAFEWGHHVLYARTAGLDETEIAAIATQSGALPASTGSSWTAQDRALLRAADELHETQNIADDTWQELSEQWDSGQLVEIAFVVGNYTMLSMLANSTQVPLEPGLPPLPEAIERDATKP